MKTAIPLKRQLEYMDLEFGLFIHFGIRSFYEGYNDWDSRKMSPEKFNPEELDCAQWIECAKTAGMKYAVMTCKHHDGFANWQTDLTDFSVKQSPWKGGKGDVVAEFTKACREGGLKVGLYYSPAEHTDNFNMTPEDYDKYLAASLGELMSNYGKIDMLWIDGCGSDKMSYNWESMMSTVRKYQPDINVFSMGDPDYMWVRNESGVVDLPNYNTVHADEYEPIHHRDTLIKAKQNMLLWMPKECDCMIRNKWFYNFDDTAATIRPGDELLGLYYMSVGRGANLLLNIGPNSKGLIGGVDKQALINLGAEIKRRFSNPVAVTENFIQNGDVFECTFKDVTPVNHLVVKEDLTEGEHILKYKIEVMPRVGAHKYILLNEGYNIGHKAICQFPTVGARAVKLTITEKIGGADSKIKLNSIELFRS